MKICLVIESYPPNISGGVSIYGQRLAHGLANAGHEVFVLTTCPLHGLASLKPIIEMDRSVKVIRFSPINIYDPYNNQNIPLFLKPIYHAINLWNPVQYLVLKKILRQESPNVVHIHDIYSISLSLLDATRSLGIPLVLTLHSFGLICRKVTLLKSDSTICEKPNELCAAYCGAIKRIIGSKPDVVTAPSQFLLDFHSKQGFFKKSKKLKLTNGIDADLSGYIPKNANGNEFNILFAGRLGRHKGPQILIEAVRSIPGEDIRLHIAGDGDYRAELENLARGDERIIFYGTIPNNEMPRFYRMADVTVVPSLCYDNAPLVIQESYQSGTPVIGSRIGGIPEMICPEYNGFLFDPGNADDLRCILEKLMSNRKDLGRLGRNAFESSKDYSMVSHIDQVLRIYDLAKGKR